MVKEYCKVVYIWTGRIMLSWSIVVSDDRVEVVSEIGVAWIEN
jgi:hypothetical protein